MGSRVGALAVLALLVIAAAPSPALADVSVARAELSGDRLRIEGGGAVPNATMTVDGTALGRADGQGEFRLEDEGFRSSTCTVTVSDGSTSARADLAGCTPTGPGKPGFHERTTAGLVGQELGFQADGSTSPGGGLAFVFAWGDGTTLRDPASGFHAADPVTGSALGGRVTHAWSAAGSFPVTVTAVDSAGRSAVSDPITVTVSHPPAHDDCGSGADAGNSVEQATPITTPVTCSATIDEGALDPVDVYSFEVSRPFALISVRRTPAGFSFDPTHALVDPDGIVRSAEFLRQPLCASTPCAGDLNGRFFGFTADKAGTWKLEIRARAREAGDYTLQIHLGGGGDDCAASRDPSTVPAPFDAPNMELSPGGTFHFMSLLGASEANCRGALPPADNDHSDFYAFPITDGEAVAVAVLPDVDTQHCPTLSIHLRGTEIELQTQDGPFSVADGSRLSGFCLDYFDWAFDSGRVVLKLTGFLGGLPPALALGYGLRVATFSRHDGDCFSGADAGDTPATAHAVPLSTSSDLLPVNCIGDIGGADEEDWYRFSAESGMHLRLIRRVRPGEVVVRPRLLDPDGLDRTAELQGCVNLSSDCTTLDKDGEWRIGITDSGPLARPYGVAAALRHPRVMTDFSISPASVAGGGSAQGTVSVTNTGICHGITLFSDNSAVATVPDTVSVCSGRSERFTVTTKPVTQPTTVTISGSYDNETRTAPLTVMPPSVAADTVSVQRAEYDGGKREPRVEARSSSGSATLRAFVEDTGQLIGTLSNKGSGRHEASLSWPVNPQRIEVRSSLGGAATAVVAAK